MRDAARPRPRRAARRRARPAVGRSAWARWAGGHGAGGRPGAPPAPDGLHPTGRRRGVRAWSRLAGSRHRFSSSAGRVGRGGVARHGRADRPAPPRRSRRRRRRGGFARRGRCASLRGRAPSSRRPMPSAPTSGRPPTTSPTDARGLVPALVIGDTSRNPPDLTDAMLVTGMSHLSAVSGSNVTLVLAAGMGLCGVLGIGRRARPWVALAVLVAFVVLARPEPSVVRAAVMGCVGSARPRHRPAAGRHPRAVRRDHRAARVGPVAVPLLRLRPVERGDARSAALRPAVGPGDLAQAATEAHPAPSPRRARHGARRAAGGPGRLRPGRRAPAGLGVRRGGARQPARRAPRRADDDRRRGRGPRLGALGDGRGGAGLGRGDPGAGHRLGRALVRRAALRRGSRGETPRGRRWASPW